MCDPQVNPPFNEDDRKCYVDKSFRLKDRVDSYEICLVIKLQMGKIFKHLGGTPAPLETTGSTKALAPHIMQMDPSDGKMEDDLY
eukprot:11377655-Karenia_brevis.AAC.1